MSFTEPRRTAPAPVRNYELGFTPWASPMLAVTDSYEQIVLGFRTGKSGVLYVAIDGRNIPAEGTALFHLGTEGGAS